MKKYLALISILSLLCLITPSYSQEIARLNIGIVAGGSGQSECTLFASDTTYDGFYYIGVSTNEYMAGQIAYDPGSNKTICRVDFYFTSVVGNISTKTFNSRIYTISGTTLGSLLGTSDNVSGSGIGGAGWVQFDFSTPVAITTGSDYAILVTMNETDVSNYVTVGYHGTITLDGAIAQYKSDISFYGYQDKTMMIKLYSE